MQRRCVLFVLNLEICVGWEMVKLRVDLLSTCNGTNFCMGIQWVPVRCRCMASPRPYRHIYQTHISIYFKIDLNDKTISLWDEQRSSARSLLLVLSFITHIYPPITHTHAHYCPYSHSLATQPDISPAPPIPGLCYQEIAQPPSHPSLP